MKQERSNARSFIEALHRRGIDQVFANSGTDHAPIVEALAAMKREGSPVPTFHVIPHENLAMAMAQGYYRASGKPAVVLVHVTVGTANAVCSLMNAQRGNIPVLLVAGRNPLSQEGHVGSRSAQIHWGQDVFDQNALVREYTKWEHELRAYQSIDALIDRALVIAMSEPRGPVYLTLPRELLADPEHASPGKPTGSAVPSIPNSDAIAELATALAHAERPAIVTSTIGVDSEARLLLEELAARFAIPVLQSWPYAVNVRSSHPMNMRQFGLDWLVEADVILTIDSAVPWVPKRQKPRADATVVHMGADPAYGMYPYRDFPASQLITGSSKEGLRMLAKALEQTDVHRDRVERREQQISAQVEEARQRRESLISAASTESPINAAWTAECINNVKTDNAVIVNELGVPFSCLEFSGDEVFVGETTAGALGTGIGLGLGAKLADPDRMVVCCVGDGCFMFGNPTPATDTMPLTRFGYCPDYRGIAVACGAYGETVTDPGELEDALRRGLERNRNGQAALIDVVTAAGTR
jgi:acetolactate synthase-1/2/3 large subunit